MADDAWAEGGAVEWERDELARWCYGVVKGHIPEGFGAAEPATSEVGRAPPVSDALTRCKRAEGTAGTTRRPHGNRRYDVVSYRRITTFDCWLRTGCCALTGLPR